MAQRFKRAGGKPRPPRHALQRMAGGVNQGFELVARDIAQVRAAIGALCTVLTNVLPTDNGKPVDVHALVVAEVKRMMPAPQVLPAEPVAGVG